MFIPVLDKKSNQNCSDLGAEFNLLDHALEGNGKSFVSSNKAQE